MGECIDLIALCGRRYRMTYELPPDLRTDAHGWPREAWPWIARIACRHGHIGVQGGDRLHAFTGRRRIGAELRRLPFVERAQGDAEVRVVFHVDHLADVLALAAVGAAHRFGAGDGVQGDFTAPESTHADDDGESDIPA